MTDNHEAFLIDADAPEQMITIENLLHIHYIYF